MAYLFISHDLRVVRALSHRVMVMKGGRLVESGNADEVFEIQQCVVSAHFFLLLMVGTCSICTVKVGDVPVAICVEFLHKVVDVILSLSRASTAIQVEPTCDTESLLTDIITRGCKIEVSSRDAPPAAQRQIFSFVVQQAAHSVRRNSRLRT